MDPGAVHGNLKSGARPNAYASGPTMTKSFSEAHGVASMAASNSKTSGKGRKVDADSGDAQKRRCVSTACIACRKRKSKCDGTLPACAACASVYHTECVYDPNSDHRRKGVYKKDIDSLKTRNSTLQTLIHAILNVPEEEVMDLVQQIRSCESLDKVADAITARENGEAIEDEVKPILSVTAMPADPSSFEGQLSSKMGELRLEEGSHRFIGGTSNLLYVNTEDFEETEDDLSSSSQSSIDPVLSWTSVTDDKELIQHLLNMYFTWHYTFFTTLSKSLFDRDFALGRLQISHRKSKTEYCSPLLVNVMCALGCHFTAHAGARDDPDDPATAGDHFFREARRLLYEENEAEKPKLTTVQALALMSVREAGCGREARGWTFSGMSFRMACDLGINFESGSLSAKDSGFDDDEEDARRITFWGCFLFDKCWSNYMGRLPMYQMSTNVTVPKFEVFPTEEANNWVPYTDSGFSQANSQPSRVRAVALQIIALCEISSDLVKYFYHPVQSDRPTTKQQELKRLSEIHSRLETWKRELPAELEPKEGGLSSVLTMHMLFQLLYIHLFRPFLKYSPEESPLPSNVSPRKLCTTAATTISKLLRLYKRSYGLRQICNIVVYIAHAACTIHLLNLPDKNAKRDITHGFKHLEEIAEGWLCARRTLKVLSLQVRKWRIELPEEAASTLARTDSKFGTMGSPEGYSPDAHRQATSPVLGPMRDALPASSIPPTNGLSNGLVVGLANGLSNGLSSGPSKVANGQYYPLPALSQYSQFSGVGNDVMVANTPSTAYTVSASTSPLATNSIQQHSPAPQQQQRALQQQSQQRPGLQRAPSSRSRVPADMMFGGVEALLKEGQDWLVRDGSSLANGFENWQGMGASTNPSPNSSNGVWYSEQIPQQGGMVANAYGNAGAPDMNAALQQRTTNRGPRNGLDELNERHDIDMSGFELAANTYDENAWYH